MSNFSPTEPNHEAPDMPDLNQRFRLLVRKYSVATRFNENIIAEGTYTVPRTGPIPFDGIQFRKLQGDEDHITGEISLLNGNEPLISLFYDYPPLDSISPFYAEQSSDLFESGSDDIEARCKRINQFLAWIEDQKIPSTMQPDHETADALRDMQDIPSALARAARTLTQYGDRYFASDEIAPDYPHAVRLETSNGFSSISLTSPWVERFPQKSDVVIVKQDIHGVVVTLSDSQQLEVFQSHQLGVRHQNGIVSPRPRADRFPDAVETSAIVEDVFLTVRHLEQRES